MCGRVGGVVADAGAVKYWSGDMSDQCGEKLPLWRFGIGRERREDRGFWGTMGVTV